MNALVVLRHAGTISAATPFVRRDLGGGDPLGAQRLVAWTGPDGMAVGRVNCTGLLKAGAYPHTELIIVESGGLVLEDSSVSLRIGPGEVAIIGRGSAVRIDAGSGTSWIFCAVSATVPAPMLQRVNLAADLAPSPPPAADVLLSAEPRCRQNPDCSDKPGRTRVGVWDSTPYTRRQVPHRVNELMYILDGSVTLFDESERANVFGKGDCVFVPHLTSCAWQSGVPVRKLYCVQDFD